MTDANIDDDIKTAATDCIERLVEGGFISKQHAEQPLIDLMWAPFFFLAHKAFLEGKAVLADDDRDTLDTALRDLGIGIDLLRQGDREAEVYLGRALRDFEDLGCADG